MSHLSSLSSEKAEKVSPSSLQRLLAMNCLMAAFRSSRSAYTLKRVALSSPRIDIACSIYLSTHIRFHWKLVNLLVRCRGLAGFDADALAPLALDAVVVDMVVLDSVALDMATEDLTVTN